ncbi:hypothetical protein ABZ858_08965 [Streptomyces sp. NPDC047017]|uniref:hypothetical protein n=1 Tax=Streptomyces sp. NPDC047017 TaxID=3155024 RepID=UPI0033E47322
MTRPKLGPWLRAERGKYDGIVTSAVDRLGRNVVAYGHEGVWNLDDPNDENRFTREAWGAQMELRAIQRRNRDATKKIRAAGRPKGKPSYGFRYVRTMPNGRGRQRRTAPACGGESHGPSPTASLADPENVTPSSEGARLNRLDELASADHLAVMYGKPAVSVGPRGGVLSIIGRAR